MIRWVLCTYLGLVMLAGPALCCCTTRSLTARLMEGSGSTETPQAEGGRSCCHCQVTAPRHQEQRRGPGKPECPARPSCPCKEQGSHATPLRAGDSGASLPWLIKHSLQGPAFPLPMPAPAAALSPWCGPGAAGEATVLPFLTAQDLLHTLHILRC
jgi:hypothetical protein